MVYRVIGVMSGSSLDGLDIAYVHLHAGAGKWSYEIVDAETYAYSAEWAARLGQATELSARDYLLLHSDYGRFVGERINGFIQARNLDFQVQLVASHGHTTFHLPARGMTAQLGDGATIAAVTGVQVVTDLRALDVALGGQGAPIVPIGEKLLLPEYGYYLNLGGIANLSVAPGQGGGGTPGGATDYVAFDVCPAGRVLNLLAERNGEPFDRDGRWAASGEVVPALLESLNALDYYGLPHPKSLANEFGSQEVYGLIEASRCSTEDGLRTYVEHIAMQVERAAAGGTAGKMLITGGGAHNVFLTERIGERLAPMGIEIVVADKTLADFKEALIMALIGVLRLRMEDNTFASVTGARRDSIGGALWNGQES